MKKTLAILTVLLLTAFVLPAQTNTIPTTPGAGLALLDQITNVAFVGYGAYIKDSKKVGGGVMAVYNINQNIGTGLGTEVSGNQVQVLSGNVEFKLPIHPLKFLGWDAFTATPWVGAFVGTPLGGAGGANGGLAAGAGGGIYFDIVDIGKGWKFGVGGGAIQWTGAGKDFNGLHILGFLEVNHGI